MAAAPAASQVTGPADSLEVRWILPGRLPVAAGDWFGRFPAGTETREHIYLLQPRLPGLSVKLRDASALDVKAYLGGSGIPHLPVGGRVEFWRKWSFPYVPPGGAEPPPAGWIFVRKQRRSTWFPLAVGQEPDRAPRRPGEAGCTAEIAEVHAGGSTWWTVGLEAAGPAGVLADALSHAADLVFARPLPAGIEFSAGNSLSYTQWLTERFPPGEDRSPPA